MSDLSVAAPTELNGSKILFGIWDAGANNDWAAFRAIGEFSQHGDQVGNLAIGTHLDGDAAPAGEALVYVGGRDPASGGHVRPVAVDGTGRVQVLPPTPTPVTVMASASHTTDQTVDITNIGAKGIAVILDVTIVGTGNITLHIAVKDPASGKYITLLTGAAVSGNGTTVYRIYPTLTAAANLIAQDVIWDTVRIVVVHNNANAITYSVGSVLLP